MKAFSEWYIFEDLERWFYQLIGKYEKWARYQIQWKKKRDKSIKNVEFPFAYREGQKNLVTSVYRTILKKEAVYSGTDRSWKDDRNITSGSESSRRGIG